MNITLYKYSHELNLMDKGSYLLEPLALSNVIFKDSTSIVKPTLRITGIGSDGNGVLDYNYVYIQELSRYYFVDNIISVNNQVFDIMCTVDVLYTYRTELLQLSAYVSRNEYTYSTKIKDDYLPLNFKKNVSFHNITNLSTVDTLSPNKSKDDINYLLVCTSKYFGGLNVKKCQPDTDISASTGNIVTAYAMGTYGDQGYYIGTQTMYEYVKANILTTESLRNFVKFIIAYPFNLPKKTETVIIDDEPVVQEVVDQIHLGDTVLTPASQFNILKNTHIKLQIADFKFGGDSDENNFLNFEPYSSYEIFLPYYGYAKISAHNLINRRIAIFYEIDVTNGSAIITIKDVAYLKTLWSSQCQIGVRCALDSSNAYENDTRKQSIALTSTIGFLSSALALALSGGNPLVVAGSIAGMASSIGTGIAKSSVLFDTANVSISSGNDGLFLEQSVFIKKTTSTTVDTPDNYNNLIGRPLEKVVNISDMNGFTVINDIHLSNIKATSTEKEMLLRILKDGFIREQS